MKRLFGVVILFGCASLAFAGRKISPELREGDPNTMVEVILRYKSPPSNSQLNQLKSYAKDAANGPNGNIKKTFKLLKAVHVRLPLSAVRLVEADPSVEYISPNLPIKVKLEY